MDEDFLRLYNFCVSPKSVVDRLTLSFINWLHLHDAAHHAGMAAHLYQGSDPFAQPVCHTIFSQLPPLPLTMDADSQRTKGRDTVLSALNIAIETLNLAKDISTIAPAQAVFGSVSILLTMIRVRFLPFSDDTLQVYMQSGLDGQQI